MSDHNIIFCGTAGAGKTTAIAMLSDVMPLVITAKNSAEGLATSTKAVGVDYGEIALGSTDKLSLYGTTGCLRFDAVWKMLGQGALGLIILIDNRRSDPLADLDRHLDGFAELIANTACVVAVSRMSQRPIPGLEQFAEHLELRGILCPVLPIDVRDRAQVVQLVDLLLLQLNCWPHCFDGRG